MIPRKYSMFNQSYQIIEKKERKRGNNALGPHWTKIRFLPHISLTMTIKHLKYYTLNLWFPLQSSKYYNLLWRKWRSLVHAYNVYLLYIRNFWQNRHLHTEIISSFFADEYGLQQKENIVECLSLVCVYFILSELV